MPFKIIDSHPVLELQFDNAAHFLAQIRLSSTGFAHMPNGWLFRGQAQSHWKLIPSLCREQGERLWLREECLRQCVFRNQDLKNSEEACGIDEVALSRKSHIASILVAEYQGLQRFADLADEMGFDVTLLDSRGGDFPAITDKVRGWDGSPNQFHAIEGAKLAQHHGVPTRLLDWTTNPLAAAFFAAEDAIAKNLTSGHIVVWCFNAVLYNVWGETLAVRQPRHANTYLRAQHGVFTFDPGAESHYLQTGEWRCHLILFGRDADRVFPTSFRITLPVGDCPALLELLRRERVTRAHLMPTLDNVASTAFARTKPNQSA